MPSSHEELSLLKEENYRLVYEKETAIADLEECKSELFKLQNPIQISDDTIRSKFEQLHRSIDTFVFDTIGDVAQNDALFKMCRKQRSELRQMPNRKPETRLSKFINSSDINTWGPYDSSNLYILSVIIQWILEEKIFKQRYPMGIGSKQIKIINDVEKGMRRVYRSQGQSS